MRSNVFSTTLFFMLLFLDCLVALRHAHPCVHVWSSSLIHFCTTKSSLWSQAIFFLSQAGNVVTGEMVEELILAGADIIKVGVGPGKTGSTAEGECGKEGSMWLAGTGDGQEGAHEWPIHKFKARFFWNYHWASRSSSWLEVSLTCYLMSPGNF